jgi:hypothetical protein
MANAAILRGQITAIIPPSRSLAQSIENMNVQVQVVIEPPTGEPEGQTLITPIPLLDFNSKAQVGDTVAVLATAKGALVL